MAGAPVVGDPGPGPRPGGRRRRRDHAGTTASAWVARPPTGDRDLALEVDGTSLARATTPPAGSVGRVPPVDREPHRRHPLDGRRVGPLRDLVADRHPLGQLADVGDDPDHAAARAELLDRARDRLERVGVERAEALVEEDRHRAGPRRPSPRPASWSASARASASDAWNVSPPESVRAERTSSALAWSTTRKSRLVSTTSEYCPPESSSSRCDAPATSRSSASADQPALEVAGVEVAAPSSGPRRAPRPPASCSAASRAASSTHASMARPLDRRRLRDAPPAGPARRASRSTGSPTVAAGASSLAAGAPASRGHRARPAAAAFCGTARCSARPRSSVGPGGRDARQAAGRAAATRVALRVEAGAGAGATPAPRRRGAGVHARRRPSRLAPPVARAALAASCGGGGLVSGAPRSLPVGWRPAWVERLSAGSRVSTLGVRSLGRRLGPRCLAAGLLGALRRRRRPSAPVARSLGVAWAPLRDLRARTPGTAPRRESLDERVRRARPASALASASSASASALGDAARRPTPPLRPPPPASAAADLPARGADPPVAGGAPRRAACRGGRAASCARRRSLGRGSRRPPSAPRRRRRLPARLELGERGGHLAARACWRRGAGGPPPVAARCASGSTRRDRRGATSSIVASTATLRDPRSAAARALRCRRPESRRAAAAARDAACLAAAARRLASLHHRARRRRGRAAVDEQVLAVGRACRAGTGRTRPGAARRSG